MAIFDILAGLITNIHFIFYLASFFIGGIPFGLILAKKFADVDLKNAGSQSIGATNVLRVVKEKNPVLAKKLAVATVILDALKGVFMLIAGSLLGFDINALWLIGILAIAGHCFSPYLKFEGGKGIATGAGVMLFLLPIETLIAIVVWFICGKLLKISSVASLSAVLALIISVIFIHGTIPGVNSFTPLGIIVFIIFYKHIPNIIRLIKKEENKVV
ncbi:MAG: glycerol-3-phosphate 1-O-acyltransferase PlsY [Campylobacteraceae bacterium]|jgi:glycerol-3-phosphate acyltransferase PlsY|nr:glycerol-3-phosphate 1-O-acyltransferase PlsY [Campylobacteraceae bacterium]